MGARVRDQVRETQPFGAFDFMNECFDGFAVECFVWRCEVDQVRVMSQCDLYLRLAQRFSEELNFGASQLLGSPLIGVLREKLYGFAGVLLRRQERLVIPAGNRHVSAEKRHDERISEFESRVRLSDPFIADATKVDEQVISIYGFRIRAFA